MSKSRIFFISVLLNLCASPVWADYTSDCSQLDSLWASLQGSLGPNPPTSQTTFCGAINSVIVNLSSYYPPQPCFDGLQLDSFSGITPITSSGGKCSASSTPPAPAPSTGGQGNVLQQTTTFN